MKTSEPTARAEPPRPEGSAATPLAATESGKLLLVHVAALSYQAARGLDVGIEFSSAESVFPAVTCVAQATMRTGLLPAGHGVVANGFYQAALRKTMFWEQSSALVEGARIWHDFRCRGGRVAMLFWQQSMGEDVDVLLTPAPIHRHGGSIIDDCYSRPAGLYRELCGLVGARFRLHRYWGPAASARVGDWIAAATAEVMSGAAGAPELCMTYLPSLDYDFQRYGTEHRRCRRAVERLESQLKKLLKTAAATGYDVVVFGDYAIAPCSAPAVFPNRILRAAGLLQTRDVRGRLYADLHASRAFAMVDHEVAHIYVAHPDDIERVRCALMQADGIGELIDAEAQRAAGLYHEGAGALVAVARPGGWFAYPWWSQRGSAPDYASHIDIHNKPGFDPCELFFSLFPPGISQDTRRVRGTHGRVGKGREIAVASTVEALAHPGGLTQLAAGVREYLRRSKTDGKC